MNFLSKIFIKETPYSNSINRIGLGLSYVVYYWYTYKFFSKEAFFYNVSTYDPKGILAFFDGYSFFVDNWNVLVSIYFVSLLFYIVGLFTHISSFLLLFVKLVFIGLTESINREGYWCHGANVVLIAHIAFLFASPGKISLDYLIVKRIPKLKYFLYPFKDINWFNWLAALCIALMFFNAFCWKMYNSGLDWAFSDNMRNILIMQYTMAQSMEVPWYIVKILEHEFLYKGLAVLNLIAQVFPMLAIVFYNRWKLRAFFGFFFVLEVLGLLYIVTLWDMDWALLYVFFIDWEELFKRKNIIQEIKITPINKYLVVFYSAISILIISAYLLSAFRFSKGSSYCYKMNLYPFSSYPMYSDNVAKKPYNIHKSYERPGFSFEFFGFKSDSVPYTKHAAENELKTRFSDKYRAYHEFDHKKMVLKEIHTFLKNTRPITYDSLIVFYGFYTVDAYPASPFPKIKYEGKYGTLHSNGNTDYLAIKRGLNNENKFFLVMKSTDSLFNISKVKMEVMYEMQMPLKMPFHVKNDTLFYYSGKLNGYYSFFIFNEGDTTKYKKYHSEIYDHSWGDGVKIEL